MDTEVAFAFKTGLVRGPQTSSDILGSPDTVNKILQVLTEGEGRKCKDLMTPNVIFASATDNILEVSNLMIEKAISQGNRFILETDYIDDLGRPGAVLGLKSVPKKTFSFFEKGIFREEDIWKIHKENPEKVFGIQI